MQLFVLRNDCKYLSITEKKEKKRITPDKYMHILYLYFIILRICIFQFIILFIDLLVVIK